jgi:hypothetical protein
VFLRGDNLLVDENGIASVRQGCAVLSGPLADLDVHSLFCTNLSGTEYRFAGAGDRVYRNGTDLGATFAGSGSDIIMGDFMGQVFMARSTTKKRWDEATGLATWGIAAPAIKPSAVAKSAVNRLFASCDSGESPAITVNEGTSAFITGYDGTASGAIQLTPTKNQGRAVMTKIFSADTDFLNFSGQTGQDNDIFDMVVALDKPEDVEVITVMVGLKGTAADPFQSDYYYFDFNIGGQSNRQGTVQKKTSSGLVGKVKSSSAEGAIDASSTDADPLDTTRMLNILDKPQPRDGRSRERKDSVASSPAWFHLSVPRGQFNRVGATSTRTWATVTAVKLIYKCKVGSTGMVAFDKIQMFGGGDRILTGTFKFRYRFVRDNGNYVEKSPFSPPSDPVVFDTETAQVTIPLAAFSGLDSGVNQTWIYMYGGFLDTYYRVVVTGVLSSGTQRGSHRIDIFPRSPDGTVDANDRVRHISFGFAIPSASGGSDMVIDVVTSEIDALQQNIFAEVGCIVPPDNIVGIEGDYQKRLWALASNGFLYPSQERNPSTFNVLHAVRVGDPAAVPYWVKKTNTGLFVGTSEDIFRVTGTATEFPDGTLDIRLENVNVGNPPVDGSVAAEGNFIVYRSDDGWRIFTGQGSVPVPRDDVDLLWRGYTRHGVSPINKAGRFKAAIQRQVLSIITPEGSDSANSTTLHRFDFARQQWYRHVYPFAMRSIASDFSGNLVAGNTVGEVVTLDSGTQDKGANIVVTAWTRVDDDGQPLRKKDPMDFTTRLDTGGATLTLDLYLDGSASSSLTMSISASGELQYKRDISAIATFRQAQLKYTGSFSTFKLYDSNLFYRLRPQTHMAVDTGYLTAPGGAYAGWVREVRMQVNSPADLNLLVYFDDVLYATKTITIAAAEQNKTLVKKVKLGRDAQGTKTRLLLKTSNAAGTGEVGFECYWIEARYAASGDQSELPRARVSFNEQIPQSGAPQQAAS